MPPNLTAWIMTHAGLAALVFARASGLAWTAPALATPGLDARLRLCLGGVLGLVLMPAVGSLAGADPAVGLPWTAVGIACLAEVLIGAVLGWSAALVVAGARQAGELVGAQAGLSPAALFDPEASDDMTALGHLYGMIALGAFLALDGPLAVVRALLESFRLIPAGSGVLAQEAAEFAFGRVGQALALSLRAAAPAAVALMLAGVALGLLGRAAPSLQLLALAMPIRAALGLILVLLSLAALAATLVAAWGAWPGPLTGVGG